MGKRAQREATRFDFAAQRRDMVEHHIAARGVLFKSVLRAMRAVRREEFLPSNLREFAYEDSPLPIASGQTISQPYVVAFMIEALLLKGGEDVLEIGTGSGHAAAIVCTENPSVLIGGGNCLTSALPIAPNQPFGPKSLSQNRNTRSHSFSDRLSLPRAGKVAATIMCSRAVRPCFAAGAIVLSAVATQAAQIEASRRA